VGDRNRSSAQIDFQAATGDHSRVATARSNTADEKPPIDERIFRDSLVAVRNKDAQADLEMLLRSVRPDQPILAHRWIELHEEVSLLHAFRSLRPPKYKKRKRWMLSALLLALFVIWEAAKNQVSWIAGTALVGGFLWWLFQRHFGSIELNSIMLFYPDKAALLSDVQIARKTGQPSYASRRDAAPGAIVPKFCISALNPFWRSGHFSFTLRGQWLILSRQSGFSWRRTHYQQSFAPDQEVTFAEMTRRLHAYRHDAA
jgi:hypothetical protein